MLSGFILPCLNRRIVQGFYQVPVAATENSFNFFCSVTRLLTGSLSHNPKTGNNADDLSSEAPSEASSIFQLKVEETHHG